MSLKNLKKKIALNWKCTCDDCRHINGDYNMDDLLELVETAYRAGIDEAVGRVKALKRPRFIKMNGGREMYDKFSFFYNQALDDFIKALQDNK